MLKISVVTAVYNRANTIAQSIESVQWQTYPNIEHIIQDGASSDGTIEIILKNTNSKTLFESKQDSGIYDAINCGIRRSTGDIIGLMHSDDFFANTRVLERVANAFGDPMIDGVYGDLHYVAASNPERVVRHWKSGEYHPSLLKYGWMPPHPTLYLRRNVYERFGCYDTSFRIAADYDAMLRYLGQGNIRLTYIPEVLVKMRTGGESNRSISKIIEKSREDLRAIRASNIGGISVLLYKNIRKLKQFYG